MTLQLNEEQMMLKEAANGWLQDHAGVPMFRKMRKSGSVFSDEIWRDMAGMGWCGLLVEEKFGGSDFGFVGAGIVAEEMGKSLTISPFISTAVIGATAIGRWGSESMRVEWLPKIVEGSVKLALATDEAVKHNPLSISCAAERDGSHFVLNGSKTFVADGQFADQFIVSVRTSGNETDAQGVTLFLVDAKAGGLSRRPMRTLDARDTAHVKFENVRVSSGTIIGKLDMGAPILEALLSLGRAVLAAEMVGAATQSFDLSVEYLKVREQFGRIIGTFQALQHRAAQMYVDLTMASSIAYRALLDLDINSESAGNTSSIAKAKCGEVALSIANESIQLHGGVGMTDEYDVGLYFKRIRVAQEQYGDYDFLTDMIASSGGY